MHTHHNAVREYFVCCCFVFSCKDYSKGFKKLWNETNDI